MLKPPLRAASLVVALIIGMQAPAAFATDLGAALNFGLLSLKQGLTFGKG